VHAPAIVHVAAGLEDLYLCGELCCNGHAAMVATHPARGE
jgi:hypothetical protein